MVSRKEVIRIYKESNSSDDFNAGIRNCLEELFGDKCLPDKEQSKPKHDLKVYIEGFQDGTLSMSDVRITECLKFRTIDEVKQAADGIRDYLKKFHETHQKQ